MKQVMRLAMLASGLLGPVLAYAAPAKDPSGVWLTEDRRARIQIEMCGAGRDQVCGYVVWMDKPLTDQGQPKTDRNNPDPAKAKRSVLGHQLMMGLKANDDGRYEGEIYNNEDGKKYDVTVWLDKPGQLKVKGCLVAFLCSTQNWTKTADIASGQLTGPAGSATGPHPEAGWATAPSTASAAPAHARPKP